MAGDNPWLGQQLGKKQEPDRKRLSEDALLKLLKGRYSTPKFAQVLSDLLSSPYCMARAWRSCAP